MPLLTALAISIGVLGGLATWLFVGPAAGLGLQIWAAFIAWAAFYHSGGGTAALTKNIPAHIFGGFVCLISLIVIVNTAGSLGLPVAAGIFVGIGAATLVVAANVPALAVIPSQVYGFASTAAYALLSPGKLDTLTSVSLINNPWLCISASMIVGALFGYASEAAGKAMAGKPATA
ncbi:MAG: DUF1097 domain-containing protein [Gemmobacter sp.]